MKKVLSTRFLTVPDLLQLKRERIPLELGCATTVHNSQGDTCTSIATSADDQWQHRMWSRQMLFTLLTMVERLCQITFVGFNADNISSLLRLRTHWHADADTWCQKVNLLRSISPAPLMLRRFPIPVPSTTGGFKVFRVQAFMRFTSWRAPPPRLATREARTTSSDDSLNTAAGEAPSSLPGSKTGQSRPAYWASPRPPRQNPSKGD